jgi:glycosyltransferase involved in cell wall biosynthesis
VNSGLVLYAPNVHTGGGLVLLRSVLAAWPADDGLRALLDARARSQLDLPPDARVSWVHASARSRLAAERELRQMSGPQDTVLCFHGLPPLLPSSASRVVVFLQNRNYLGLTPLSSFSLRTAVRLAYERAAGRLFRRRVSLYVVQSETMARDLARWCGAELDAAGSTPVLTYPFVDALPAPAAALTAAPRWDFVYVSDGEAHKNHRRLFEAWQLLAAEGLRPRLALTLGPRDSILASEAAALRERSGIEIHNLGHLPREQVLELYTQARALIFPSASESFGLPLVEAQHLGLPILAPERDYVRDVCVPAQTFDPESPTSIARAVLRFLGVPDGPRPIGDAAGFLALVRGDRSASGTAFRLP